jgi:F-type H+-transporting ATPase subunit b
MVVLNFTLFVLLGMFLGFLWVMHRFIFRPLLALMDARENQIADDKQTATSAAAEAAALEDQYGEKIARMHREASLRLVRAHRQAQEEHNGRVAEFKSKAEDEIQSLNESLAADIASQEDQFAFLAKGICDGMANKLELE